MKHIYILIAAILTILATSCETEVDLKLKTAEPRLVIDASLGSRMPCRVKLSMTQGYWNQEMPEGVSGAVITIKSGDNIETLKELSEEGLYISRMLGKEGETYTLTVQVGGEEYVATEYLPFVVPITAIRTFKVDTGDDQRFFPCISFTDPEGIENYYYYSISLNERKMQGTDFESDKNFDGKLHEPILFFDDEENNDEALLLNDYVLIEMESIGKGAYTFYNTITSPGGIPNSNPVSNFSGDVLGMFKTFSMSYAEMTVTEEDMQ